MNKYRARKGSHLKPSKAQALGEIMERIGFAAPPERLVAAAKPKSSPIHDCFVWDNSKAADSYRIFQARNLINSLEIIVLTTKGERSTKAFHSVIVSHNDKPVRGYCSLETIVENEDLNAQVVRKALQEATYWRHKYAEYKAYPELRQIFDAIDRVAKAKKRKRQRVA